MTQDVWGAAVAASTAGQIRRYREAQGLSAQQLADACQALGMDTSRSTIANLESGRRPTISLAEVLVFARALDVPPILLIFPIGSAETVQAVPGVDVPPWQAAKWFTGTGPLDADGSTSPPAQTVRLFQRHDRYVAEYEFAARKAAGARSMHDAAPGGEAGNALRARHAETAQMADRAARIAEEIITETRDDIHALGLVPPPLPAELTHLQQPPPTTSP